MAYGTLKIEEVRIPETIKKVVPKIFLPSGIFKEKSQPGPGTEGKAKRRPR
jgi:hypothetical protein